MELNFIKSLQIIKKGDAFPVWDLYLPLETEESASFFLEKIYSDLPESIRKGITYRNTPRFMAFASLGRTFFRTAEEADLLIRPMLYYYGMIHLTKLLLISHDPDYPVHVAQLAHGVTTRKMKRTPYRWLEDEVKIQREGLIPSLIPLFDASLPKDKIKIGELLSLIPELEEIFFSLYGKGRMDQKSAERKSGEMDSPIGFLPETVALFLLAYHLGMLSRYEGEIWIDLIGPVQRERILVHFFLNLLSWKFPALIMEKLQKILYLKTSIATNVEKTE